MLMAKTNHITFNPHFDGSKEQVQAWARGHKVTQTEFYHIGALLLACIDKDTRQEMVDAYILARRENKKDLAHALDEIRLVFSSYLRAKNATTPPSSVLADAADAVLSRKTRNGKAAG